MGNEEVEKLMEALEAARAKFHGLSAAVALHLEGKITLDLEKLRELLQDGSYNCAVALGYNPPARKVLTPE